MTNTGQRDVCLRKPPSAAVYQSNGQSLYPTPPLSIKDPEYIVVQNETALKERRSLPDRAVQWAW